MSCLYRTLSYFHDGITTEQMRHLLCDYLSTDPQIGGEKASQIIPWETKKSLAEYLNIMRNQSQWGGAIEIKAYCDLFKKNVKVLSYPNRREIEFISNMEGVNEWVTITWNGYHYEPVTNLKNPLSQETSNKTSRLNRPSPPNIPNNNNNNNNNNNQLPNIRAFQNNNIRMKSMMPMKPMKSMNQMSRCNCPNCQRKRAHRPSTYRYY